MGLAKTIDITPQQRQLVLALLRKYLPGTTVWVYGSRVKGTARPYSDLDPAVFADPQQQQQIALIKDAFDESDLPFRVNLFAWYEMPESFHKTIAIDHAVLQQEPGHQSGTVLQR